MLEVPIEKQPYCIPGSWISFFYYNGCNGMHPGRQGLYLRSNIMPDSGGGGDAIFKFILLDRQSNEIPFTVKCTPGKLTLQGENEKTEVIFDRPDRLRFRNYNSSLRLATERKVTSIQQFLQVGNGVRVLFCLSPGNFLLQLYPLSSKAQVSADRDNGWIDLIGDEIVMYEGEYEHSIKNIYEPFEQVVMQHEQEFEKFRCAFPALPGYEKTRDQACFLLWSLRTLPRGLVKRPMTLVSRIKMSGCWAWDHCFPALAAAACDPDWAYNDFMVMLDDADKRSGIHDLLSPIYTIDIFTKPPVHGWFYSLLMRRNPKFFTAPERLNEVYQVLIRWQKYWTETRAVFHSGMPVCFHGNDSGWDNSSVFLSPLPLSTPDIQSFLVLQSETLNDIAKHLQRPVAEQNVWKQQRDEFLANLLSKFSDGTRFYAVAADGKKCCSQGDSLQLFLPLLLTKRLPESLCDFLIKSLKAPERFKTQYGLATENITSSIYTPDGYWRGPIWAPPTLMMVHALLELHEKEFALLLAESFCELCKTHGFYENFNALTGLGQRDSGMSWTASVFLIFQEMLTTINSVSIP